MKWHFSRKPKTLYLRLDENWQVMFTTHTNPFLQQYLRIFIVCVFGYNVTDVAKH